MRWGCIPAVVIAVIFVTGCAAGEPSAESTPSAAPETSTTPVEEESSPAAASEPEPLGTIADIAGTKWRAEDSDGDFHNITFAADGTLTIATMGISAESSWSVDGETVQFTLPFGPPAGIATMTGTLNPATQILSAAGSDQLGELTMEMTQIPLE